MSENRFLEDFLVGEIFTTGGVTITEGEIIHFAFSMIRSRFIWI